MVTATVSTSEKSHEHAARIVIEGDFPVKDVGYTPVWLACELLPIDALRMGEKLVELANYHLKALKVQEEETVIKSDPAKKFTIQWLRQNDWFTDDDDQRQWLWEQIIRFNYSPDGPDKNRRINVPVGTLLGEALLQMNEGELPLDYFEVVVDDTA